jgi:signal transduction histidine kinase
MRLLWSLTLGLTLAITLVLGGHGWLQLSSEARDLDATARWELALLTTALRGAIEDAVLDGRVPDIAALLARLELRAPGVDVYVLDEGGQVLVGSAGSAANLFKLRDFVSPRRGEDGVVVERLPTGEVLARTALALPRGSDGNAHQLMVLRPTEGLEADLSAERAATLWSMLVIIVLLSTVTWLILRRQVHLPLAVIGEALGSLGRGDLTVRLKDVRGGELGELGLAINRLAEALEASQRELAAAAEVRARLEVEMQRANRLAIVGELAATLAHEIGSPLLVLNGRAIDLAARPDLADDARRSAQVMVEQTSRVHGIVERLLGVARRRSPEMVPMDPMQAVRQVTELVSPQARRLGVRIGIEGPGQAEVEADPAQMQQIILNLLQNALRAMERGGALRVAVVASSETWELVVEDDGPGIPEALRTAVFEPFYSAWPRGSGRQPEGTGLGLTVVRSLAYAHGGRVAVREGRLGRGACVAVTLPRSPRTPEPVPTPLPAPSGASTTRAPEA